MRDSVTEDRSVVAVPITVSDEECLSMTIKRRTWSTGGGERGGREKVWVKEGDDVLNFTFVVKALWGRGREWTMRGWR